MATKIGDLFFDVYADVAPAAKDIEKFVNQVKSAGGTAAKAIGETIANAVGIAVGATALLTASTLSAGVAYNTLGQSATAAFSSIYGDLSAAHSILSDISLLDLETPFAGKALTATARTLAGFGFELQDVVSTTEALAQATAAMGLGSDALHRMAIAFGQIQSRGKLAGDEARQLANYGIDAYGLLADQLGLTVAAVRELGQEGKLTSDFVIPALVESIETRFAGATEALFNTAAGQAEGLRSIFEGIGSALIEPIIGFSKGGALVEAMDAVRTELVSVVSVAEDGSFRLAGFLSPLNDLMMNVADGIRAAGDGIANFFAGLSATALTDLVAQFEGLEPLIAGLGAGLLTVFAQAIPFVGRFVAGFNPIVVGITVLLLASDELRASLVDTFNRIWEAAQPLIPGIREFVSNLLELAEAAIPVILDAVASAFEDLAPLIGATVETVNELLEGFGPVLLGALQATADALKIVAEIVGALPPQLVLLVGALYLVDVALSTVTVGLVANTAAAGAAGGAAALAATQFGILATAIGAAYAATLAYQSIRDIGKGQDDLLFGDQQGLVGLAQPVFQAGFKFAHGDDAFEMSKRAYEQRDALNEGREAGIKFAESMRESDLTAQEFGAQLRTLGLSAETNAFATLHYSGILKELEQDYFDAARAAGAVGAANLFEARAANAARTSTEALNETLGEEIDYLSLLEGVAQDAWEQVDMLSRAGADSVVDNFLSGLAASATELTEALAEPAGALRDLAVNNSLDSVGQDALKVINVLSKEYGMSMEEIISYFDERGLAGVIEALGQVTEQTTEAVDPLVAKYSMLGATADQLHDAISRLEEQRTSALEARIDAITDSLEAAKQAAEDAKQAFDDYFMAGSGGLQGAIDSLVLDIPSIGDQIEAGLLKGGPQGEAMVRQAIGDAGSGLASIFQAGMEQGFSADQIIAMLGPVYGSIQQEIAGAMNRISSLDWEEGFAPATADALRSALAGILDPGQIQSLMDNITGSDNLVGNLEAQLDDLNAQLNVEVEFSPEQVQDAIAEIQAEVTTTAVITPEAAQLVFDAIQDVFNDEDLTAAVDQAVITQEILDAVQDAEDQIALVINSGLSFDSAKLDQVARAISQEFYAAFQDEMNKLRDARAQQAGFDSYSDMVSALGPQVAAATIGAVNVSIDAPISVTATGVEPGTTITASQQVAGSSAAAGSGGQYDPSKYNGFGTTVIPGYRGPQ